jgi:DNA-directed RNA polymerase subunit H (RpoH/RPB5)|uniref:RNA polymerase subunit H/Rpb5 C-terminal domain-containing protein n=1 Tax=viral metagenome TaxID=1070528 RepID=A0A6C0BZX4_9ZZZZ
MSAAYNPLIPKLYKSRKIILDVLAYRGFNVDDHTGFNINNIQSMYNNKQMDILLTHPESKHKVYVKYNLGRKLGEKVLYEIIDDLYEMDEILKDEDDLVIVSKDRVNDTHKKLLTEFYNRDKKFINIFNIDNYCYNVLENKLQPEFNILKDTEKQEVMKKYNMKSDYEFPTISRFDPVALAIGLRPSEVCEITRPSPTSITSKAWRICV